MSVSIDIFCFRHQNSRKLDWSRGAPLQVQEARPTKIENGIISLESRARQYYYQKYFREFKEKVRI